MKIANIVTNNSLRLNDNFNVVNSINDIIIDLPTLIVGWDIVKQINPNADYFDRKLTDEIFWTFYITEHRDLYEEDLYKFKNYSYKNILSDINYEYLDFILLKNSEILDKFKQIKLKQNKILFEINDMIYIYVDKTIYGINLEIIEYVNRDKDKLFTYLKSFIDAFLPTEEILIEYKDYMENLNYDYKFIPYLYSINNHG